MEANLTILLLDHLMAWFESIPICEGNYVHICNEVDPHCGLTFQRVENVLPFIRLPRALSLKIILKTGHHSIIKSLQALEKHKRISLVRSDQKRIFGDYGTKVMYTWAGVQVSRRSWDGVRVCSVYGKIAKESLEDFNAFDDNGWTLFWGGCR